MDAVTPGLTSSARRAPGRGHRLSCPNRPAVPFIRELFDCLHRRCNDVIQPRYLDWVMAQSARPTRDAASTRSPGSMPSSPNDFMREVRCLVREA